MHSSAAVANRFLEIARERGGILTPMKLLKLVYIAHGWMLGLFDRPLINDRVEAWQYGPVVPALYRQVREFRGNPVTGMMEVPGTEPPIDEQESDVIRQVYDRYGHYTAMQLSRMTHARGTPWEQAYEPDGFSSMIPAAVIADHYRRLAERAAEHEAA